MNNSDWCRFNFQKDVKPKNVITKMSWLYKALLSAWFSQCQIGLLFFPLHYFHSFRDGLGVKKSNFFSQINLFSFCARIEPKLSKLQKTVKMDKKSSKKPSFLTVFWIFYILGSILAQKNTNCKYLSIVPFFCHPGHP